MYSVNCHTAWAHVHSSTTQVNQTWVTHGTIHRNYDDKEYGCTGTEGSNDCYTPMVYDKGMTWSRRRRGRPQRGDRRLLPGQDLELLTCPTRGRLPCGAGPRSHRQGHRRRSPVRAGSRHRAGSCCARPAPGRPPRPHRRS
ncbi:DUF2690 domain-containing protein [Oryzihumus sp.]